MSHQRTHYVTTSDGVRIGGTVHGEGPALVFWQGIIGDGDLDWQELVRHLTGRFTCYLPSWRGRGLSGDHPDLGWGRLVDDVLTYLDSIAEPTGLVGWSAGADMALVAAGTQPDAATSVACIEPVVPGLMDEHEQAALGDAVARAGQLAADGRLTDAVRAFAGFPCTDEDIAAAEKAGYFKAAGRYVPRLLDGLAQVTEYDGPTPDDAAVLAAISAPVLVLNGSDNKPYSTAAARHVADHAPNARIRGIRGAGHLAPLTHPEALAEALAEFFSLAQQPPPIAD